MIGHLGAAQFYGVEWDLEIKVDRYIRWAEPYGAAPWGKRIFPSLAWDSVDATCTVWVESPTWADAMESLAPSGSSSPNMELALPGLDGVPALPGFGTWADDLWKFQNVTLNAPVEPMGRKAPITSLWGYKLDLHFAAAGGGTAVNELGGVVPSGDRLAQPSFFGTKFIAHQIQDWSKSYAALPYATPGSGTSVYPVVQHGLRRDGAIAFDHLSATEMSALVDWYRGVGTSPFAYLTDRPFGPGQPNSVNAVARDLVINRGPGFWWEGKLDVSLYI